MHGTHGGRGNGRADTPETATALSGLSPADSASEAQRLLLGTLPDDAFRVAEGREEGVTSQQSFVDAC